MGLAAVIVGTKGKKREGGSQILEGTGQEEDATPQHLSRRILSPAHCVIEGSHLNAHAWS